MVIQLGILVSTYIGVRLIDIYKKKKNTGLQEVKDVPTESRKVLAKKSIIQDPKEVYDHYFKASLISLGIVLLVPFSPVVYFASLAFILYTCIPILKLGEKQIFQRHTIGHDALYSLYIILCFATHQELFLALGVMFYHAGSKLLSANQALSKPLISNLFEAQPETVWVLKEGIEIELPLGDVQKNDIVVIRAGEVIPVDGHIIDGIAMIDQHALTGESQPVEKESGEKVYSSTLVVSGRIQLKVEKAGNETSIYRIGEILNNTASYTTSIQLKGERWANMIALPMFGITLATIPTMGLLAATAVVHSSFGNRLRVLAPIGTLNFLHEAYAKGILIKDGRAIEELIKVDTILFDKTGTLTHDQPEVASIIAYDSSFSEDEVLIFAATAERKLSHPIAHAIVKKAEQAELSLPAIDDAQYKLGYGVTVSINDQIIRVGSARFMKMQDISLSKDMQATIENAHTEGYSLVLVAVNSSVVGAIKIEAVLRPEVNSMIARLRKRGIEHMSIVSGDHQYPTQKLADTLGMDSCFYEVLPEEKADIVKQLQKEGKKVCFIGDGVNDTIAMKTANVSVSLRGATSIATDTAQVVLMGGNLEHFCDLFDTANKLHSNLVRTLALTLIPAAMSLGGALFMGMRLAGSFVITYGGFAIALGNVMQPALRLKQKQKKKANKEVN